jgi:hypothetical protein
LRKYLGYGDPYVEREYNIAGIKRGDFRRLSRLHKRNYKKIRFEKVMGIKLDEEADAGCLYHTYSGGFEFLGATHAPQSIKDHLKMVLIEGVAELATHGIDYVYLLPSNLRYHFDGRLICSPHNSLMIYDRELSLEEQVNNLSALLYTHSWIENTEQFLDEYLNIKGQLTNKEKSKIKNMLEENIKDIDEDNLVQVPFCWWPHWGSK